MGIIQLNSCFSSAAAMDTIAVNEFVGIVLDGDPYFIGSAGTDDTIDWVLLHYGQAVVQQENDRWEYYKSMVVAGTGSFLKAWLHWNGSEFNAYLSRAQGSQGDAGFASHAMPYVQ